MKFFHLSDLHLGIKLNGFNLIEDQRYILERVLDYVREERPQAVLLAGDIYDKSVPPEEAVALFDYFLNRLAALAVTVCIIAVYHDSMERLAFGGRLLERSGVHIAPAYDGRIARVRFTDEFGEVYVHLLSFLRPATVRHLFPEAKIENYNDALQTALAQAELEEGARNVLVAHQYVCGSLFSGTDEIIEVGGIDNAGVELFAAFDYTALGHIHRPQDIGGSKALRYSGTPLKYSLAEIDQEKSVTVLELGAKGDVRTRLLPLKPLREVLLLRGAYDELISRDFYSRLDTEAYVQLVLTDEEEVPDAMRKLQGVYRHVLGLRYENRRTAQTACEAPESGARKPPLELFREFYAWQNNQECSAEQEAVLQALLEEVKEEDK